MEWKSLMNAQRVGEQSPEYQARNPFQRDFDRIVFSPAFRRLQSKTQVFPLPETDFIHTRLTHSLESSCVGRSLGQMAGELLFARGKLQGTTPWDLSSVVAAANLAHDIGNPPFGHGGEEAISDFFRSDRGSKLIGSFSPAQQRDLVNFEGNAMGFRILTRTNPHKSRRPGGLGITKATVGAFTKYPCDSMAMDTSSSSASRKKYGVFQSDFGTFSSMVGDLGMNPFPVEHAYYRHPLAYLVEASDDICYLAMDLEDGYRLGLLPFEEVESLYLDVIGATLQPDRYQQITAADDRIAYLRAVAINTLVTQTANLFCDSIDTIFCGELKKPLTLSIPAGPNLARIRTVSVEKIYSHRKVQEIEAAGFEIISGLLDCFIGAMANPSSKRSQKVLSLVSSSYRFESESSDDQYEAFMYMVQFVAGMTDRFAIETYRTIKGISLPTY